MLLRHTQHNSGVGNHRKLGTDASTKNRSSYLADTNLKACFHESLKVLGGDWRGSRVATHNSRDETSELNCDELRFCLSNRRRIFPCLLEVKGLKKLLN